MLQHLLQRNKDVPSQLICHILTDISTYIDRKRLEVVHLINPIYIIHPDVVGWDIENIKFQCNNGICMPINLQRNFVY